ncbi:hypothetical protein BDQ17DRAFT_1360940 [Cyathus striatus]|nr:hypothetical protein BDQ17DRAFT_1360940 [Cyathus striatus]
MIYATLEHQRVLNNIRAASFTICVYDTILLFSSELIWIWPYSWNKVKVLYLLTRYLPLVEFGVFLLPNLFPQKIGPGGCYKKFLWVSIVIPAIGIILSGLILSITTYAILGHKRVYKYILSGAYITAGAGIIASIGVFVASFKFDSKCQLVPNAGMKWAMGPFIILFIYSCLLMFLMSIEPFRAYRYGGGSRLLWTVYRNGLMYYVCMFALTLSAIIIFATLSADYWFLLPYLTRSFNSVLICRIVIRTRRRGNEGTGMGESDECTRRPALVFAQCFPSTVWVVSRQGEDMVEFDSYDVSVVDETHGVI